MPIRLEGFIDNGRGAPAAGIPAVATRLSDGVVVDTTVTDADGYWLFTGLATADEHLVTLSDTAGNAVSRAPWSGELREAYVRDRLEVAGKPVLIDVAAGNSLAWTATGLFVPPVPTVDLTAYYTKTESDARYAELTDVDPFPQYLTSTEADALFLTPAEGNAAYATSAHNHDTTYVQLTGGSVMTGLLGPTTTNTRDLGTTALRWRALYGMTGDFTTSLTVATKPITPSPDAANIIEFRANGLYAAAGAVTDIWVNTTGDTMTGDLNMTANVLPTVTNVRSLGSTSLRWLKVWAQDADFTNAPTVGGAALLTSTTADALFLTPAEGNAAYATTAHNHDATYVNATGDDTMTGQLSFGTRSGANLLHSTASNGFVFRSTPGGADDDVLWQRFGATAFTIWDFTASAALITIAQSSGNTVIRGTLDAFKFIVPTGTNSAPSLYFGANTTSGLFSPVANAVGVTISTVERLRVDSTGLAVTGAATISTTLSVNSRPVIMAGCRVTHNATQAVATATNVALAFNTERFDTDNFHDTVTNNSRLTVPAGLAGKYLIYVHVEWAANTDATARILQLRVNGGTYIGLDSKPAIATASITTRHSMSTVYDLAVNDYVEIVVHQLAAGSINITSVGNFSPEFGMQRLG
jgi:hypothetical protein